MAFMPTPPMPITPTVSPGSVPAPTAADPQPVVTPHDTSDAGLTRELGQDRLTMAGLAERLGVGAMTLYSYFRSRDELLDAMARRAAVELYDRHVDLDGASWMSNCGSITTRSGGDRK